MLTQEDKNLIIELRQQGLSLKAIHEKLGFAIETIRKVLREDEEKKTKKLDKGENKKAGEDHNFRDVVSIESTEEGIREFLVNIGNLIKKGQMKESFRKELEKYFEELENLLRIEVDDRIAAERADAIEKRDVDWNIFLEQQYVKKEDATNLENTINSKDATIDQLRNEIAQKDAAIINKQDEIFQLKDFYQREIEDLKGQIGKLAWEKQNLINDNWRMHNIIQDYSDNYERREQEYQKRDEKLKEKVVKLENSLIEVEKKFKENACKEKKLDEQAEILKKREDEFNKEKKRFFDALNERIKEVENREKNVIILEKRLLRQNDELDREIKKRIDDCERQEKEIKQYKEKQMEEIKNEKEKMSKEKEEIEKTKGELKAWDQRLRKMERTLKKIFGYYGYSNLYKSFSNKNQVGKKDQETTKDKKPVTLHPV